MTRRLSGVLAFVLLVIVSTSAQRPLTFEVASVRPSGQLPPGSRSGRGGLVTRTPERLTYERAPFHRLLTDAFGVERGQIKGAAWATADTVDGAALFDVSAKVPVGATPEQVATMLQNLLKERFKLAVHRESAQDSGYALVIAKGGAKISASAGAPGESERNKTTQGPVNLQIGKDGFPELFPQRNMGGTITGGTVRMRFRDYPIADLVQQFSLALAVRVIDRTGLAARYDFTLEFTLPENGSMVGILATMPLLPGQSAPMNRNRPTVGQLDSVSVVSSAMERHLGLKLEGATIAIDTLVIDHAERTPTEN